MFLYTGHFYKLINFRFYSWTSNFLGVVILFPISFAVLQPLLIFLYILSLFPTAYTPLEIARRKAITQPLSFLLTFTKLNHINHFVSSGHTFLLGVSSVKTVHSLSFILRPSVVLLSLRFDKTKFLPTKLQSQ
jgi:hypothetical protein